MHEFFAPKKDGLLGSQLRREALAARRDSEHLPARISLAVRSSETRSSDASSSSSDAQRSARTQAVFYALAAVLCLALALPALWNRFTPAPSVQGEKSDALLVIAPAPLKPVPLKEETQVQAKPVESPALSRPKQSEDDLALLTADVQAAVDTLLATLPVDVDINALVLP